MPSALVRTLGAAAALSLASAAVSGAVERRPIGPRQESFERFGADEGLESSAVNDLAQDGAGNLWIATHEGVVRYDGARFTTFGRHQGLPASFAFDLELDAEGTLWAATLKGLARFAGSGFVPVDLPGSPAGEAVETLGLDTADHLLAGAIGGVWRCRGGECARIFDSGERRFVTAIARDQRRGELWFAGEFGLVSWAGRELERWDRGRGFGSSPIRGLLVDRRSGVWIRQGRETWRLDRESGALESIGGLPPVSDRTRLYEDRRGTIWATSESGLFVRTGSEWRRLGIADGLPSDSVSSMLEDFEGSLWLGTAFDGIARWRGRDRFSAWSEATGLPDEIVWAVTQTSDGRLAFGTAQGIAWGDRAAGELVTLDARDLPGSTVLALEADGDGGFWAGFEEGGLAHVDRAARVTRLDSDRGLPPATAVLSIESARDGTLWLGTTSGVWRGTGSPRSIHFERVPIVGEPATNGLPEAEAFHDIRLVDDGTLWAAGRYGLARFTRGEWRRFTRADGLADDWIISIDRSGDGNLWVAYREALGVSELKPDGERFAIQHFDRGDGLAHDQTMFVRADVLGRLWVGTTRGVSVRSGARFASFGRRDGMRGDDLCVNSFHAEADGTVWLGSTRGAISVRVSQADLGPPPRPAARILLAALGGIPIAEGERLEVDYEFRDFEVRFGAKTFVRAQRDLEYRFRLSGVDREPVTTTGHGHTYGALSPGRYEFTVEARTRSGGWGPPATLGFAIRPPWWSRAPAQIAALVAAALFGVLVDRVRGRRQRRRQAALEQAVAVRTSELQASREELARKNDELGLQALTDPLTGLRNRRFAWELLAHEVARVDREWADAPPENEPEARIVFFLMDVDLFKEVNDRYGHEVGDQILIEAAERVRAITRLSDVAVRWGGEEFLVVARDLPRSEWAAYAARLRQAVALPPYRPSAEAGAVSCTASLGYAAYPFEPALGIPWQQVLHLADLALYAVKQCGRNADLGVEPGVAWSGTVPVDLLASQMSGALHLHWSSARGRRR